MAVGALAFCQAGRSLQWCLLLLFVCRPGPASAVLVLAARLWLPGSGWSALRFSVVFEGAVRHPPSVPVRSLFRRFLHAVPLRSGPAGGRPGCALAVP